ncbi:FISUMP domain-containing protein [Maribellus comscasis]|uniref:FISUMP domain-containing protein n=1 Tax=Maribellus comscasis TaxID=2681766 RepID=UPI00131BC36D|nr:FISUMP domain-containing protein [Maribellus comscasis]
MKRIFTFLTALLVTGSVFAQSPQGMSYQAVIRNSNDELVTNQSIGMQISVLQGSADGTTVYKETQTPTTNTNGLVSIEIGNGTLVSGDFSSINWANGPYFIKTEADPEGGTAYTITGTSQLMSVPYALYSKTAETVTGGISETDPDFNASIAAAITEEDTARWNNMANDTSKIQDINLSGTDLSITDGATVDLSVLQDGTGTDSQILTLYNNKYLYISNGNSITLPYLIKEVDGDPENELQSISINGNTVSISNGGSIELPAEIDPSVPAGTQVGDMQYWNGSEWITVPAGNDGQMLSFIEGMPTWTTVIGVTMVGPTDVYNPITGEIWMDRNLGATQVATRSSDVAALGDLYQWGRAADGHESRTSESTSTLSSTDTPGHGDFILSSVPPEDWRSTRNNNLWQGVNGTNNPCPSGYRLPTDAEWEAERASWSSNDAAGAFASPLKLPQTGNRTYNNVLIGASGTGGGDYWSSTVDGSYSGHLFFYHSGAGMNTKSRAMGYAVRCIKD